MNASEIRTMTVDDIRLSDRPFRHIFIVQNRSYWKTCPYPYDTAQDLVLSFDFAMVREVTKLGGAAAYLDHLVQSDLMESYNHETYHFLANWYLDKDTRDIFSYREIPISNALRLYIWNDVTYTVHILINLLALTHVRHEKLYVGTADTHVMNMLKVLNLEAETWTDDARVTLTEYFFPIFRWMHEQIYPSPLKRLTKIVVSRILSAGTDLGGRLGILKNGSRTVFIQPYYPTNEIIKRLNLDPEINVVLENPTEAGEIVREKFIPSGCTTSRHRKHADGMVSAFHNRRSVQWRVEGIDIGDYLYAIILERAASLLPYCLKSIDDFIDFFEKRQLQLMITTTNIGMTNCLMLNYCRTMNIPTYLIVNGYMTGSYLDESKDARWINSYGISMKEHYFSGMENIVCLGDPRMDAYVKTVRPEKVNRDNPTIVIGAGGYSNIDLNSYVAVEFDFLNDILETCRNLIQQGRKMNIVVKVRANGYIEQYKQFVQEYYPDLPVKLYDRIPMKEVLLQGDFYISIYSGTLFEASSLGIPVLYYKKDTEILFPPFDGKSELVTAGSIDNLMRKMERFYEQDRMFDAFKNKSVLEKYIGPLDGENVERNLNFIYSLLETGPMKKEHAA
jgi:hypothetical protein